MIKTAMMQPTFMPWQGIFELINDADYFVFLDDFQYCPRSHHTRNKLFTAKEQIGFYSVNVQKPGRQDIPLNEVNLSLEADWQGGLLKKMKFAYAKAPYFEAIFPKIERWLSSSYTSLATLNIEGIKMICSLLHIEKKFLYSSDFTRETGIQSKRTQHIIDILNWAKADLYLSAFGSFDYMKEDGYDATLHPVLFQNFEPKPYKQVQSDSFVPYLSVLDAMFNVGAETTLNLIRRGTDHWLTFEERGVYHA